MDSPTKPPLRVLIVEDREHDAQLAIRELRKGGYAPVWERVDTRSAMTAALERGPWDLILCDYSMPTFNAPAALALVKERGLDTPFIIVSGTVGEDVAVEAMKAGVHDYVLKGALTRLGPAVARELLQAAGRVERRNIEDRLAASDQMLRHAQKMEAVGALAAGVAHDFNNLLSVILSYSEMLMRDDSPRERLNEDLKEIHSAALRAADLTRQLLAFSRQQVLSPRVLNLNETLASLDRMLRRLCGEDIEIEAIPTPGLHRVRVDPGLLDQVIMNLAVNARDAMPRGGKLLIETANVSLDEAYVSGHPDAVPGPYVMLAVSDTGVGMTKETQARAFDPFFTTKERGKGTGLGLATVFGIVKQSGGIIWLYSELGKGTTFKIFLPVSEEIPVPSSRSIPAPSFEGTETVLIADDDASVRQVGATILERLGYRVLVSTDVHHAIELCGSPEAIHILVTDVMMPGMSGPDLAEHLLTLRPALKVLYVSGYTPMTIAHHRLLRPGVHFLQKPITPAVLARKVRQILDDRRGVAEHR
jgi:two-component system cell cycle sensor histidine kinase/response regulator CckA